MTQKGLLREYVREVLVETGGDGGAMDIMMSDAAVGPYGMHYGSSSDLYKIFVKPFTDVVDTAIGKTKELSQKTLTLAHVAFETVATSLVPILRDSYAEIFAKEKQQMEKIRSEYAEVYKSNWDAFKDNDVVMAAFMYAPTAFLTLQFARKSPKVAAKMISVLSGGELDGWLGKIEKKFGWNEKATTGLNMPDKSSGGGRHHSSGFGESLIREDKEKPQKDIASVLTDKKVLEKLQQSHVVQKMQQEGQAIVRGTLSQVYKQAQGVLSARSIQEIQTKTGAKIKGLDKLSQVPQESRQAAEQAILTGAKQSMKEFYTKNLEAQAKQAVDGGISESSPYVKDILDVVAKIKAL